MNGKKKKYEVYGKSNDMMGPIYGRDLDEALEEAKMFYEFVYYVRDPEKGFILRNDEIILN